MEGNRDEAERCIDIALIALNEGNLQRAEKFLKKADSLYPLSYAKELLTKMHAKNKNGKPRRRAVPSEKVNPSEPIPEADYTKDQLEIVKKIKRCKSYYQVLGVTKESTDSEIKKSYKKLALQLHPDKNKAPGAVESFKAIGNAVAVLTDPEKRKAYDLYGIDDNTSSKQHNHHAHQRQRHQHTFDFSNNRNFDSDMTADELFNLFFGSTFPSQPQNNTNHHVNNNNNNQRRYQNRHEANQQPSLAFAVILVLIVVSMMSSFFTSDPIYSLQTHSKYPVQRKTFNLGVPYYVKNNFENEYQGSIARLENSVEEEYITMLKQSCYREKNYREAMIVRARSFGSKSQSAQAQGLKTPSCDILIQIGKVTY